MDFGQRLHHGGLRAPTGWLTFRKYDGHSILWLPRTRKEGISGLWSIGRSNKPESVPAPRVWLSRLPQDTPLHGELWSPDDRPQTISSATVKNPTMDKWAQLKLVVFAFPSNVDSITDYSELENTLPWMLARERAIRECKDCAVVMFPDPVESLPLEWEGLVHQNPVAGYKNGRTHNVLKYKPAYDDEAIVVGYEAGKTGARLGTTGAIQVLWEVSEKTKSIHGFPEGMAVGTKLTFSVSGLDSSEWNNAEEIYPIGDQIRFKFLSISNLGTPMHCSILRGNP